MWCVFSRSCTPVLLTERVGAARVAVVVNPPKRSDSPPSRACRLSTAAARSTRCTCRQLDDVCNSRCTVRSTRRVREGPRESSRLSLSLARPLPALVLLRLLSSVAKLSMLLRDELGLRLRRAKRTALAPPPRRQRLGLYWRGPPHPLVPLTDAPRPAPRRPARAACPRRRRRRRTPRTPARRRPAAARPRRGSSLVVSRRAGASGARAVSAAE